MRILVALGGNAILRRGTRGDAKEQFTNVDVACKHLVKLLKVGNQIAITHGNGPQVGDILLASEMAKEVVEPMPLDVCGAESQGMIGYMLQQSMDDELRRAGLRTPVATILTQTVVDANDPAFRDPTKPIGPFYSKADAERLRREKGWTVVNDSGRGYRRVVPSPHPRSLVEAPVIARLFEAGVIVIAAGGGGVPVTLSKDGQALAGVEAVIDKDLGAAVLAKVIKADVLMILTDVDKVYLDYDRPRRRAVDKLTVKECRELLAQGQFPAGSMGPKVESAVGFVESGGERAIITSLGLAEKALSGKAGTAIVA
jgi:carbamate kinase